jgi:pimeloyl-ACP methyl ester carboxylesterase
MTFDRRVADAIEVVEFLRKHLRKDKVILLAESMGTLTGTSLVMRRPGLFDALVVTDLYVNMARNEARKYQLTLDRLRAARNSKAVAALERIGADSTQWDLRAWNTNMGRAFKTNLPTPNPDRSLLFPLALSSPIYTLRDLYTLFVGFQWSTAQMFVDDGHRHLAVGQMRLKVSSLVAGMLAGADSIDDLGLLRHGGIGRVFTGM